MFPQNLSFVLYVSQLLAKWTCVMSSEIASKFRPASMHPTTNIEYLTMFSTAPVIILSRGAKY